MVMLSDLVEEAPHESVTLMTKDLVAELFGVPWTSPVVESRLKPWGRDPDETVQVNGPVPPPWVNEVL